MDISSMSPAPFLPEIQALLFPTQPNPPDWLTPEGRAGLFTFHFFLGQRPEGRTPPDLHPTPVISTSWKEQVPHSPAAPNTCPKFSSLSHALLSPVQAPRNRSCRANLDLLVQLLPEPHGPSAPSPGLQDLDDNS